MKTFTEPELLAYLDGQMSAADVAALEEALRADPQLRRDLLARASLESELPCALQELEAAAPAAPQETAAQAGRLHRTPPDTARKILWFAAPLAAAACLLVVLYAALHQPRPGPALPPPPVVAVVEKPVAPPVGKPVEPPVVKPVAQPPEKPVVQLPAIGNLTDVNGEVCLVEPNSTNLVPVTAQQTVVHAGASILLATNATATFAFADGSVLKLYRNCVLTLQQTEDGPRVDFRQGALDADIRHQPDGKRLVVQTRFLRADIVGTEFRVMGDSASAWVGVRTGDVQVTRAADGQKVALASGNYAAVAPNWPFMRMNARVCPLWKSVCQQAAGSAYP